MITFISSLVLSLSTLAQESPKTYISPCFPNSAQAQRAFKKIEFIKAPIDKVQRENNCIEILTVKRREELFKSYLAQNFRLFTYKEVNLSPPKSCNLELIKTSYVANNEKNIRLGQKNNAQIINDKNKKISINQITVQSGASASIGSTETKRILLLNNLEEIQDRTTLDIKCTVLQKGYQIEINSSDPKHNISTSTFLAYGASLELSALNKNNKSDSSKVDFSGIKKVDYHSKGLTTYRLRAKNQRK